MIPRSQDGTDKHDEDAAKAEGLMGAVGAWKEFGDDEIDAMVAEIYRQRGPIEFPPPDERGENTFALSLSKGSARQFMFDTDTLSKILADIEAGRITADEAAARLSSRAYEDLGFAKVDHDRAARKGFPEVIFGDGKTPAQVAGLARAVLARSDRLLATRVGPDAAQAVASAVPDAVYHETARVVVVDRRADVRPIPGVGVVVASAGTSDAPVAEEAALTAQIMDCEVVRLVDVGVAGLHRLLDKLDVLRDASVVVAVAGMEGALPSVIGGLVSAPVIAVPTSVGYGASFGGAAALLAMLNSCAPGVAVVNIDNGFGAGYIAATIARQAHPRSP